MKLSEENKKTLLVGLHKTIEAYANHTANDIEFGRLNGLIEYPSNGGLTPIEKEEISKLSGNSDLKSALRKVLASNTASVFFSFLNILDGTADPEIQYGEWTDVMLVDLPEDNDIDSMLHDDFYRTYWDWKEKRNNSNWKLDLLED